MSKVFNVGDRVIVVKGKMVGTIFQVHRVSQFAISLDQLHAANGFNVCAGKCEPWAGVRHKHADIMHMFAEGAEIQRYDPRKDSWYDIDRPLWNDGATYRVKPGPEITYICPVLDNAWETIHNPDMYSDVWAVTKVHGEVQSITKYVR